MPRILAIDLGQKRTGIAVSDPLQLVAGGLDTIPTSELLPYLKRYTEREAVETVVLGHPTRADGSQTDNTARVEEFATAFRRRFPGIRLVMYDERFTSVLAHRTMLDANLRRKSRQDKALVDRISATIILQDYMESLRMKSNDYITQQ